MEFLIVAGLWLLSLTLGAIAGLAMAYLNDGEEKQYLRSRIEAAERRCRRGEDDGR